MTTRVSFHYSHSGQIALLQSATDLTPLRDDMGRAHLKVGQTEPRFAG